MLGMIDKEKTLCFFVPSSWASWLIKTNHKGRKDRQSTFHGNYSTPMCQ